MRFSERMGYRKPKPMMGREEVDDALRSAIWNYFWSRFKLEDSVFYETNPGWPNNEEGVTEYGKKILTPIYRELLKRPLPWSLGAVNICEIKKDLKDFLFPSSGASFFEADEWYHIYDFAELLAGPFLSDALEEERARLNFLGERGEEFNFLKELNAILEREKSPYRFVGNKLALVTSKTEIAEIEAALEGPDLVRKHIEQALALYSDRKAPDYRNAIKEAISAVEAAARIVSGEENASLGAAIKKLEKQGEVHSAFAKGVSSLHGWSSDTVRHAAKDGQPEIGEPEARFTLVTCSAIANFLLSKATQ